MTTKTKRKTSAKKKNPGGRPPITLKDLSIDWKDIILQLSAQGCSDIEIKAKLCTSGTGKKIKFHPDLWNALQKREKEFSEAIKIGKVLCEAWWLEISRKSLKSKVFQTGSWYANMKNRFQWSDKHAIDGALIDNSVKNYVQIYRPEKYSKEDMEAASRATDRSV